MKPYTAEEATSVIRELQRELTGMRKAAETDQGYIDRKRAVIGVLQGALERIAADQYTAGVMVGIAREALAKANEIATARGETP